MPLGLKLPAPVYRASPFKEIQQTVADFNPAMEKFLPAGAVVDLDFSGFDIDDNCYVYHIENGKKSVISQFKTELKQNDEPPVEPIEQPEQPKNYGQQDCDMVVDAVPVDMITQATVQPVSLGDKEDILSAERNKSQVRTI